MVQLQPRRGENLAYRRLWRLWLWRRPRRCYRFREVCSYLQLKARTSGARACRGLGLAATVLSTFSPALLTTTLELLWCQVCITLCCSLLYPCFPAAEPRIRAMLRNQVFVCWQVIASVLVDLRDRGDVGIVTFGHMRVYSRDVCETGAQ